MTLAQAHVYALVFILTSSGTTAATNQPATSTPPIKTIENNQDTLTTQEQTKVAPTQEQQAVVLLKDFITLINKNKNKTFAQYAEELIVLLKGNSRFTRFTEALAKMRNCKDPVIISLALSQQQKQLPESIKAIFKSKQPKELMEILQKRLK